MDFISYLFLESDFFSVFVSNQDQVPLVFRCVVVIEINFEENSGTVKSFKGVEKIGKMGDEYINSEIIVFTPENTKIVLKFLPVSAVWKNWDPDKDLDLKEMDNSFYFFSDMFENSLKEPKSLKKMFLNILEKFKLRSPNSLQEERYWNEPYINMRDLEKVLYSPIFQTEDENSEEEEFLFCVGKVVSPPLWKWKFLVEQNNNDENEWHWVEDNEIRAWWKEKIERNKH